MRRPEYELPSLGDVVDDPLSLLVVGLLLVLVVPLVVFAVLVAIELLALLALLPVVMLIRALFGGAWPIEVFRAGRLLNTEYVKGWAASRERIHDLTENVRLRGRVEQEA